MPPNWSLCGSDAAPPKSIYARALTLHPDVAEGGREGGAPAEHVAKSASVASRRTSRFDSSTAYMYGPIELASRNEP